MAILGNIFLFLSLLSYCIFLYTTYGEEAKRSHDGGYGMLVLWFALLFTGLMLVVMIAVTAKGAFDWVAINPVSRNFIVFVGFLCSMVIMSLSALLKDEGGPVPFPMVYLVNHAAIWIPMVLLMSGFILLNDGFKASIPASFYTIPLKIIFGISILACAGLLVAWMISSQKAAANRMANMQKDQDRYHEQFLAEIAANDPNQEMLSILTFSGKYHDAAIRVAVLAKIKTNPDWQRELIRLLDSYWAEQVFIFLEDNAVDDKNLFAEPIRSGILQMAKRFGDDMKQIHTLHEDEFDGDTRRILATVDQFEGLGVDYKPAVQALRDALDTRKQEIKLNSIATLDRWLKAHNE